MAQPPPAPQPCQPLLTLLQLCNSHSSLLGAATVTAIGSDGNSSLHLARGDMLSPESAGSNRSRLVLPQVRGTPESAATAPRLSNTTGSAGTHRTNRSKHAFGGSPASTASAAATIALDGSRGGTVVISDDLRRRGSDYTPEVDATPTLVLSDSDASAVASPASSLWWIRNSGSTPTSGDRRRPMSAASARTDARIRVQLLASSGPVVNSASPAGGIGGFAPTPKATAHAAASSSTTAADSPAGNSLRGTRSADLSGGVGNGVDGTPASTASTRTPVLRPLHLPHSAKRVSVDSAFTEIFSPVRPLASSVNGSPATGAGSATPPARGTHDTALQLANSAGSARLLGTSASASEVRFTFPGALADSGFASPDGTPSSTTAAAPTGDDAAPSVVGASVVGQVVGPSPDTPAPGAVVGHLLSRANSHDRRAERLRHTAHGGMAALPWSPLASAVPVSPSSSGGSSSTSPHPLLSPSSDASLAPRPSTSRGPQDYGNNAPLMSSPLPSMVAGDAVAMMLPGTSSSEDEDGNDGSDAIPVEATDDDGEVGAEEVRVAAPASKDVAPPVPIGEDVAHVARWWLWLARLRRALAGSLPPEEVEPAFQEQYERGSGKPAGNEPFCLCRSSVAALTRPLFSPCADPTRRSRCAGLNAWGAVPAQRC